MARRCSLRSLIVPEIKVPLSSRKHGHAEGPARPWCHVLRLRGRRTPGGPSWPEAWDVCSGSTPCRSRENRPLGPPRKPPAMSTATFPAAPPGTSPSAPSAGGYGLGCGHSMPWHQPRKGTASRGPHSVGGSQGHRDEGKKPDTDINSCLGLPVGTRGQAGVRPRPSPTRTSGVPGVLCALIWEVARTAA